MNYLEIEPLNLTLDFESFDSLCMICAPLACSYTTNERVVHTLTRRRVSGGVLGHSSTLTPFILNLIPIHARYILSALALSARVVLEVYITSRDAWYI